MSVVTVPWSTVVAVNDHVVPFDSVSTAPLARVWAALRNRGSYFTIGYGGNVDLRTRSAEHQLNRQYLRGRHAYIPVFSHSRPLKRRLCPRSAPQWPVCIC